MLPLLLRLPNVLIAYIFLPFLIWDFKVSLETVPVTEKPVPLLQGAFQIALVNQVFLNPVDHVPLVDTPRPRGARDLGGVEDLSTEVLPHLLTHTISQGKSPVPLEAGGQWFVFGGDGEDVFLVGSRGVAKGNSTTVASRWGAIEGVRRPRSGRVEGLWSTFCSRRRK